MRKHAVCRPIIATAAGGSLLFLLALVHGNIMEKRRQLTPQVHIDERWPSLADTQFKPDETLGMDEHLSSCWNVDKVAKLHERDEKRRAAYNEYFTSTTWKFSENPLPGMITITGGTIRMMYTDEPDSFTGMSLWNETFAYTPKSRPFCMTCKEPPAQLPPPTRILKGNFVAFHAWQWGHYGHTTHDVLPWLAYIKEMTSVNPSTKYILLDKGYMKEILAVLDMEFFFHQVVWVKYDELVEIHGNVTTLKNIGHRDNNFRFIDFLRLWSLRGRDRSSARNKIIYYDRRNPKQTKLQRFIRKDIEEGMLERIKEKMKRYGRTEELVVFNGLHSDGTRMNTYEQFMLFKDVTTIIGPHGSGLSGNMLWTNPMPRDCADRVKILEFISDSETAHETSPNAGHPEVGTETHWFWMKGWPFDYHHMLYSVGSTRSSLIIDLDSFSDALDSMWGDNLVA